MYRAHYCEKKVSSGRKQHAVCCSSLLHIEKILRNVWKKSHEIHTGQNAVPKSVFNTFDTKHITTNSAWNSDVNPCYLTNNYIHEPLQHYEISVHFHTVCLSLSHDMIYLLTAIGLSPGGSSTVHIYTQTVNRTTKWNRIHKTEHI